MKAQIFNPDGLSPDEITRAKALGDTKNPEGFVPATAEQLADAERCEAAIGPRLAQLGYTCHPAGNGYFMVYSRSPLIDLEDAQPMPAMLKFGRLGEIITWLETQ
jgi:hypothetical protein